MKIAYLILAHKEPEQLKQLVKRLRTNQVLFFIHIDKNSDINTYKSQFENDTDVTIISCFNSYWASFNLVKAELALLKKAYKSKADRFVLLSGQDYPIKSNEYIKDFFQKNKEVGFIEGDKLPDYNWVEHQNGLFRVNRFHFYINKRWRAFPPHSKKKYISSFFNNLALITYFLFFKSKIFEHYYHGGQWWALSLKQVEYILKEEPRYLNSFKFSYASDELFIQTILYNAPSQMFKIQKNHLHFIYWPNSDSPNPGILTEKQLALLKKSSCLYARKFNHYNSLQVIKEIDKFKINL